MNSIGDFFHQNCIYYCWHPSPPLTYIYLHAHIYLSSSQNSIIFENIPPPPHPPLIRIPSYALAAVRLLAFTAWNIRMEANAFTAWSFQMKANASALPSNSFLGTGNASPFPFARREMRVRSFVQWMMNTIRLGFFLTHL